MGAMDGTVPNGTTPLVARVLGAATVAYSVAIIASPRVLAVPCGLTTATGGLTTATRVLVRAIGARDAAIGTAMVLAPPGRALRWVALARVASDASDAILFGTTLSTPAARTKVAVFAAGWATLCAAAAVLAGPAS